VDLCVLFLPSKFHVECAKNHTLAGEMWLFQLLVASLARPLARSLARSLAPSLARSLNRWIARPLARSLVPSLAPRWFLSLAPRLLLFWPMLGVMVFGEDGNARSCISVRLEALWYSPKTETLVRAFRIIMMRTKRLVLVRNCPLKLAMSG